MTDRIRTLRVLLDRDMRTDDVEVVKQTIKMIRCVSDVQDGEVVGAEEHMRREAALTEWISLQRKFLRLFGGFNSKDEIDKLKRIKEILGEG